MVSEKIPGKTFEVTKKNLPGKHLIKKDGIEYRLIFKGPIVEIISFAKVGNVYKDLASTSVTFAGKDFRSVFLFGSRSWEKRKGYGPAIMEIRNRYILGDLKIKPPYKARKVFTSQIASPTVARQHMASGLFPEGMPRPTKSSYPTFSRESIAEKNTKFLLKRYQSDAGFMRKRLDFLKKHGRGFGKIRRGKR